MYKNDLLFEKNFEKWLFQQKTKSLLKFLTCGSVDDGKSTLIGRLLHDTKQIHEDHLISLKKDTKKYGKNNEIDFSLLIDGLQAEQEQGITIDVAYRYFFTKKRKFIIADTPGHEQYTKNMATGASNSDVAVILIDVQKGIVKQTFRHSFIVTLLGIKDLIVLINKMDLVEYNEKKFLLIKKQFLKFSKNLPNKDLKIYFIPISALLGDNVVTKSKIMNWYLGNTFLSILENIKINNIQTKKIRFPIQYVNRSISGFRTYSGTLSSGFLQPGKKIKILPSNIKSKITDIITFDGKLKIAIPGQSISIMLRDHIDVSRGDLLISENDNMKLSEGAFFNIVWMSNIPLSSGKYFIGKIAGKKILLYIKKIKYQFDIHTMEKKEKKLLLINDIGVVQISFNEPIAIDSYLSNKTTGSMILIDRISNLTVGAGMVINCIEQKNSQKENFEIELNTLIRRYFPHWDTKDILK